jgi:hypothetical protein
MFIWMIECISHLYQANQYHKVLAQQKAFL